MESDPLGLRSIGRLAHISNPCADPSKHKNPSIPDVIPSLDVAEKYIEGDFSIAAPRLVHELPHPCYHVSYRALHVSIPPSSDMDALWVYMNSKDL